QHVAGSGSDSYIYGSGTSMAAAVVSGAAALLLEERPNLQPLGVKAALELTSTFMPKAGGVRTGAGSLNVAAAASLVGDRRVENTAVTDTRLVASGLLLMSPDQVNSVRATSTVVPQPGSQSKSPSFSSSADILVWGDSDILVWGDSNILVWGDSDILVWGDSNILVW